MFNFVGSQDGASPDFHLTCPDTPVIKSTERRKSLTDAGLHIPCTLNVTWDDISEPINSDISEPINSNNKRYSI